MPVMELLQTLSEQHLNGEDLSESHRLGNKSYIRYTRDGKA